jgi:choline dehydrogenase-like flavoprotein
VGAALGIEGRNVLMLDCGFEPDLPAPVPQQSRVETLRDPNQDIFPLLIGDNLEGTALVGGRSTMSPKLKSPRMRFITKDWNELSPVDAQGFDTQMSFSMGGLANAWGAGVYRFTNEELRGFPIRENDLAPYYARLTREIGISGSTGDDLTPFFGDTSCLQPPLRLNRAPGVIYRGYQRKRDHFQQRGFHVGRSRVAILTQRTGDRDSYHYKNLEFFTPNDSSIYSPAITVRKLIKEARITYRGGYLVESFSDGPDGVVVTARNVRTGSIDQFSAKRLIIAAGCLNSAKIVLASSRGTRPALPLLDNLVSYVPLINPALVGLRSERRCFGMVQLNILYTGTKSNEVIQGSIYDLSGPLKSDFLFDFPLSFGGSLLVSKLVTPAMCLIQFFYPDDPVPENSVSLDSAGRLKINYAARALGVIEREAISAFRKIGWFGLPQLCKYPKAGNSYHYAGCLPMRSNPGPFETHPSGKLQNAYHTYVADSSVFTRLPSKNLTFTSMANAMRIASGVSASLR